MTDVTPHILVVEDHPALGRFIAETLAREGWSVIGPVGDHAAALEAAQFVPLDLAVLDRVLYGRETFAIADALIGRGLPCLLISGYSPASLPERFADLPFLEKPFSTQELVDAVRAALRGAS